MDGRVDRIDGKGNIRQHLTVDRKVTLCGLALRLWQEPANNSECRRCVRIAAGKE
jgi:hypothetical protein